MKLTYTYALDTLSISKGEKRSAPINSNSAFFAPCSHLRHVLDGGQGSKVSPRP